ncbi:lantibiotic dehydratase [Hyalangium versicolor]|uniref:lantibiotic dehydratase n=1 Tax=Hyalangium versicolor TaxID=2861190 RepID=UPI001CCCA56F|nr:lantibiotic dehydratase [Hyalangium versicolor]
MAKKERLYAPLNHVVIRAPLLPVERYAELAGDTELRRQLEDPRVRCALTVGSESLTEALARGASDGRKASQMSRGLLRYLIRMSTRATPYGTFAGIALASWGEATNLSLSSQVPPTHARPDMQWLLALVERLDARPAVRQGLRWQAHPAAVERAGRVLLAERPSRSAGTETGGVSVRATGAVRRALAMARRPIPYPELASHLLQTTPGATQQKVEALLTQLWEQGLLFTDLYPPLLTSNPAGYVLARLSGLPAAEPERRELEALVAELKAWDQLPLTERPEAYRRTVLRARAIEPQVGAPPLQVDMALPLAGRTLSRRVGQEVARAGELLLRLSPMQGLPSLHGYRSRFLERYGEWTEVPLLELLDPAVGLGALGGHSQGPAAPTPANPRREDALLHLALRAHRERRRIVELDDATLESLESAPLQGEHAPRSMELFVTVAASSVQAIDAGDFQLVLAPSAGVSTAGRSLGRFAHLLGEEANEALRETARAEESLAPDRLFAELTYPPRDGRSANVSIRPEVRSHELALRTSAADGERRLALDTLVVGVRDGRFYLRSTAHPSEVIVTSGHLLNSRRAPAVAQFLSELGHDGQRQLLDFHWGPAEGLPMLPRVQRGRVVLSAARWRITRAMRDAELPSKDSAAFAEALRSWRERWDVPRRVLLTVADNRLLLDLDCAAHVEELRTELEALRGEGVLLYEALPDVDQAWMEGPGGHFLAELVVPLVLRPQPTPPKPKKAHGPRLLGQSQGRALPARVRPPGSEWIFAKLYCGLQEEEELIAGPVREFAGGAVQQGEAKEWFFLRYADPEPHLRLRLRGEAGTLTDRLMPALCRWGAGLVEQQRMRRFVIDTYEPELGRYGGEKGLAISEALFAADSQAVAELLGLLLTRKVQVERLLLAVLTLDALLAGLGLNEEARLAWCEANVWTRSASAATYRQHAEKLQALLMGELGEAEVERILAQRRASLEPLGTQLRELATSRVLLHPPEELYGSYLHLHCNRLLGLDGAAEREALELLLRTRRTLARRRA